MLPAILCSCVRSHNHNTTSMRSVIRISVWPTHMSNMEDRAQPDHLGDQAPFTSIADEKAFDAYPVAYANFYYQSYIKNVMSCSPAAQGNFQKSFATFKLDFPSSTFGSPILGRLVQRRPFIKQNVKPHMVSWVHHTRKMNWAKRYRKMPASGEFILMRLPNSTYPWLRVAIETPTCSWCLLVKHFFSLSNFFKCRI